MSDLIQKQAASQLLEGLKIWTSVSQFSQASFGFNQNRDVDYLQQHIQLVHDFDIAEEQYITNQTNLVKLLNIFQLGLLYFDYTSIKLHEANRGLDETIEQLECDCLEKEKQLMKSKTKIAKMRDSTKKALKGLSMFQQKISQMSAFECYYCPNKCFETDKHWQQHMQRRHSELFKVHDSKKLYQSMHNVLLQQQLNNLLQNTVNQKQMIDEFTISQDQRLSAHNQIKDQTRLQIELNKRLEKLDHNHIIQQQILKKNFNDQIDEVDKLTVETCKQQRSVLSNNIVKPQAYQSQNQKDQNYDQTPLFKGSMQDDQGIIIIQSFDQFSDQEQPRSDEIIPDQKILLLETILDDKVFRTEQMSIHIPNDQDVTPNFDIKATQQQSNSFRQNTQNVQMHKRHETDPALYQPQAQSSQRSDSLNNDPGTEQYLSYIIDFEKRVSNFQNMITNIMMNRTLGKIHNVTQYELLKARQDLDDKMNYELFSPQQNIDDMQEDELEQLLTNLKKQNDSQELNLRSYEGHNTPAIQKHAQYQKQRLQQNYQGQSQPFLQQQQTYQQTQQYPQQQKYAQSSTQKNLTRRQLSGKNSYQHSHQSKFSERSLYEDEGNHNHNRDANSISQVNSSLKDFNYAARQQIMKNDSEPSSKVITIQKSSGRLNSYDLL